MSGHQNVTAVHHCAQEKAAHSFIKYSCSLLWVQQSSKYPDFTVRRLILYGTIYNANSHTLNFHAVD